VTVYLFGVIAFIIITTRLGFVQFIRDEDLLEIAVESLSRDIVFEPERDNILDVNQQTLVEVVSAPLDVDVSRLIKNKLDSAYNLAKSLEMPTEKAYEYVTKNAMFANIHPEGRKISKQQEKALRTLNMDLIYLAKDSERHYPFGENLA